MGITVCVAAGDNGFTDGLPGIKANVDFPSSSPYALSCGGTRLESSGGAISSETVWNDSVGATGGGVSEFFEVPSYQKDLDVPASVSAPHKKGRAVPDVCGVADPATGYRIRVDGRTINGIGGTSAVAPLWAALITLINQKRGSRLGFINPRLYQQGGSSGGFTDIVSGNNGGRQIGSNWVPDSTLGYKAGLGWDACSGWGSPDGTALSDVL